MPEPLPFSTRFWFAWVCFFRVLFDAEFAARAFHVRSGPAELPPPPKAPEAPKPAALAARAEGAKDPVPALQLLSLFQREGRFVDFLEQDIVSFPDAEIGAVARVVHEGCRRALHEHMKIAPVRDEPEGERVTLKEGFDPAEVKLTGNVQGSAPYKGVLRHRGWRAETLAFPTPVEGHNARVIAPAEVEL